MSDLRSRIGRLEQDMSERLGPSEWRASLEPYFAASAYAEHREALLDALCGPNPSYHFGAPDGSDGPDSGHYFVSWWTRSGPPVVIHVTRVSGEPSYGEAEG